MTDPTFNAFALMGNILSFETLGLLVRKGVITSEDAIEAIDRCVLNFEMQTAPAKGEMRTAGVATLCDSSPSSAARRRSRLALLRCCASMAGIIHYIVGAPINLVCDKPR